jgi:hypothetical protein
MGKMILLFIDRDLLFDVSFKARLTVCNIFWLYIYTLIRPFFQSQFIYTKEKFENGQQCFCWLFWELPPNLNWEILSTFLSTKYESEMNLGNNKQNNFAVEFISLNYSIMYMYLSFLFLNLSTNVSRLLSDSLSFPYHYLTVCPFPITVWQFVLSLSLSDSLSFPYHYLTVCPFLITIW